MDRIETIARIGNLKPAQLRGLSGGEPAFFYERRKILERIEELRAAMPPALKLAYSLKANPFAPLVQMLLGELDGADVTSLSELVTALNTGANPETIMFAGPAKKASELRAAVAMGAGICVESPRELTRLAEIGADLGSPARVLLRINPNFTLSGASMRMGGAPTQFGLNPQDLPAVWDKLKDPALRFAGIHIYWGSQCLSEEAIHEAQAGAAAQIEALAPHFPVAPEILNLGGGFGIPYAQKDRALDLKVVGENFSPVFDRLAARFPAADIYLELGRFLVGEAGHYVTTVVDCKTSHGVDFLVTNGGMHHFLAASGNLGQRIRRNYPIHLVSDETVERAANLAEYEVVGCLCTPIDLLGHRMEGPRIEIGDMISIGRAGAYGKTASPEGFLSHPAAMEFII